MRRHPVHARRRGTRIAAVVAVAGALVAVPSGASAETPPTPWQAPTSHVVVLDPPFSVSDMKRAPWDYAPLDGTSAVYVRTVPGTETALSVLDTLYPGVSAGLTADQLSELAQTKASRESSVSVIAKAPLPRADEAGDIAPLPVLPSPGGDVCADPNHCAYFMVELTANKPSFSFNHIVETVQWTWVLLSDGSKPRVQHSDFVFKTSQGENWSGSFFMGGYNNEHAAWEGDPGVWNYYVESKGTGELPAFDQIAFGIPVVRTSSNITSAYCAKLTQTYPGKVLVTNHGVAAQDTFGFSGWNTNPMSSSEPYRSDARTFLLPCGQLKYL